MIENIIPGLLAALQWGPMLALVIGVAIGMVIGAIPGLSGTMAVALAIPFTYGQDPVTAFALLAGIHNGASQGSAIPAILLRIPGSTGSIATCFDGYPMAQQGHSAAAIRLSAFSSAVGGMASAVSLLLLAPPLAAVALNFGPQEIFWLNIFGLTAIVVLVGNDILKGVASVAIGLLISTVGVDVVTGQERFTFNIIEFSGGISELALIVGMFSLPPTLDLARNAAFGDIGSLKLIGKAAKGVWRIADVWRVWVRSSIIGIILGIIPGSSGGTVFIAYTEAKRVSKKPELFGKGSPEGLAAAESVNNADNAAAMIPTLTLGIPGSAIAALMMGALLVHGMQPGPQLFRDNPILVYGYSWQMFLSSLLLIPLGGIAASRIFVQVLRMPPVLLMPIIIATMVAGVYASQNSIFNVYVMLGFGALGLVMERLNFPTTPLIIAVVLGVPAEYNLRISLLLNRGDPTALFTRPVSMVLVAIIVGMVIFAIRGRMKERREALPAEAGPTP
jgi:putative tricarboxylic transport membrane protein